MPHSLKIKILDLDHIESIVEQDITSVEAEKTVGARLGGSGSPVAIVVKIRGGTSQADPLADSPLCAWLLVEPINLLNQTDCW